MKANLDSRGAAAEFIGACVAHFSSLDLLVNNAGLEKKAPFLKVSEEGLWDEVLAVNLNGVFFASQAFAQHCADAKKLGEEGQHFVRA